jgi:tRNA pseudouridine38-40 synthase
MQHCTQILKGTHNFIGFSKSDKDQSDAVCTVDLSELIEAEYLITYRIRANRFVRHMVRRLVGSMLKVGQGKWPEQRFSELLHHPDKEGNGHGAAAKGLILEEVEY